MGQTRVPDRYFDAAAIERMLAALFPQGDYEYWVRLTVRCGDVLGIDELGSTQHSENSGDYVITHPGRNSISQVNR